ncbi:MAG: PAS domain-containing protein [Candidatus Lindowbacteria bacterium]|nr:PAS domain-containing protein [Candidatus Lindowbacteria bacterium]
MTFEDILKQRNSWVVRLRFVVIFVLTGNYILGMDSALDLLYRMDWLAGVAVICVATNALWTILLKKDSVPLRSISYYQCIFDLILISIVVYQLGAGSPAGWLYVFVILIAGILLEKRGIMLVSLASVILYMVFMLLEFYGYHEPLPPMKSGIDLLKPEQNFLISVIIKGFFFFIVGLACSHLQELLMKMTNESQFLADFNKQINDMIPVGVMVFNTLHSIEVFNPAMERISWIDVDDAMGKDIAEVFPGLDSTWRDALEKVEHSGEEVRLLGAILPIRGGKSVRVNARLQALKMNDQVLATVCTVQTASR